MNIMLATAKKQRLLFRAYHPWLLTFNRILSQTIRIISLFLLNSYFSSLDKALNPLILNYRSYLFSNILLLSFIIASVTNVSRYLTNELYTGTLISIVMTRSNLLCIHLGVFLEQSVRTFTESLYSFILISVLGTNFNKIISIKSLISLFLLNFICIMLSIILSILMLYFRETFFTQNIFILLITILSGTYFNISTSSKVLNMIINNLPLSFVFRYFRSEPIHFYDTTLFIILCVALILITVSLERKVFFKKLDNYIE